MVGIYLSVVGNIADNIFSSVMLANMMMFSNMVALKNLMHQKIKQKNMYVLVLLDVKMLRINGFELYEKITER
jgi:response regulator RpfG family c-di-GMP phosphodiesterase